MDAKRIEVIAAIVKAAIGVFFAVLIGVISLALTMRKDNSPAAALPNDTQNTRTKLAKSADKKPSITHDQPSELWLQMEFDKGQRFNGMEIFVDESLQKWDPPVRPRFGPPANYLVKFQAVGGMQVVKIRWRGVEVWKQDVEINHETAVVLKIPKLDDPAEPGTLVIKIVSADGWLKGSHYIDSLELFIDAHLRHTFKFSSELSALTLNLPVGEHLMTLKKHGIEVYSEKVDVKKPSEGKSFLEAKVFVSGTVLIKNSVPVRPNVFAYVTVDDQRFTQFPGAGGSPRWAPGMDTHEIRAAVGNRVINVFAGTSAADAKLIETFNVTVEPGKQAKIEMAK